MIKIIFKTIFNKITFDEDTVLIERIFFKKKRFYYTNIYKIGIIKPMFTIGGIPGSGHCWWYWITIKFLNNKNSFKCKIPLENDKELNMLFNFLESKKIEIEIKEYDNKNDGYGD